MREQEVRLVSTRGLRAPGGTSSGVVIPRENIRVVQVPMLREKLSLCNLNPKMASTRWFLHTWCMHLVSK